MLGNNHAGLSQVLFLLWDKAEFQLITELNGYLNQYVSEASGSQCQPIWNECLSGLPLANPLVTDLRFVGLLRREGLGE